MQIVDGLSLMSFYLKHLIVTLKSDSTLDHTNAVTLLDITINLVLPRGVILIMYIDYLHLFTYLIILKGK